MSKPAHARRRAKRRVPATGRGRPEPSHPDRAERRAAARATAKAAGSRRRERRRPDPWQPVLLGAVTLLAAAPALVAPTGQGSNGYSPDVHVAGYVQVLGLATLVLLAVACVRRRARLRLPRSSTLLPLTLIVGWAALSILWSVSRRDAVVAMLIWAGAWLAGVLVLLIAADGAAQRRLLLAIAVGAVPVVLLVMVQFLFGVAWIEQHDAPAGTLGNKNMLGQYVALTMPVTFVLFLATRRRAWTWLAAAATACMAAAMAYTYSRAAWLVLLLEALLTAGVLVWLRLRYGFNPLRDLQKKIALGVMLALIAGLLSLSPAGSVSWSLLPGASSGGAAYSGYADRAASVSGALRDRYVMWRNSLPMWQSRWLLGVGMGNWKNWYEQYQSAYRQDRLILGTLFHNHAHNDYVQIACQLGVVGLGLLAWLGAAVALLFRRILRSFAAEAEPHGNALLMLGPMVGLVGVGTSALVSFPFQQPITTLLVVVYLAILSLHDAHRRGLPAREAALPSRPVRAGIAALLIVLTAGAAVGRYRLHLAEYHSRESQGTLLQERFADAERHARISLSFDPARSLVKWFLATSVLAGGRSEEAVALFDEVLAVRPYWASAIGNKAFALANLGRHREAADELARLVTVRDVAAPRRDYLNHLRAGQLDEQALPAAVALRDWFDDCAARHAVDPTACDWRTENQTETDALESLIADLERRVAAASVAGAGE